MNSLVTVGRLQTRLRGNRQSDPEALRGRANVTVILPPTDTDTSIDPPLKPVFLSPTLHQKAPFKGATPACQSRGLKPPDHWCRWMTMDNQQA